MKRLLKELDKIEIYILLVTFPLMVLFIFLATIFRYFEIGSLTWAEEASRYLMLWLIFAGIGLGFKYNAHLGLSFFIDLFPAKLKRISNLIRSIFILAFGSLILYYSYLLILSQKQNGQVSPAMGIPMWWVYLALVFGSILIIVRTLQMMFSKPIDTENHNIDSQL